MLACPHCNAEIALAEAKRPGYLADYRICPACELQFTVDRSTRKRQVLAILLLLVSFALTMLLYFEGTDWLVPSLVSYVAVGMLIYWGNKKVRLVPYMENRDS